jgi:AcrR family transcriptional regulator
MTATRTYKSTLREDQMEQTRERILETLEKMLADETAMEVSVAAVAERAKISVRTAYRYFPTKEALLDEFNVWMRKRFGSPPIPVSMEELPENAAALIRYFETNSQLIRASRSMSAREVRKRRKVEQVNAITKLTAESVARLDEREIKLRAAMIHQLIGSEGWLNLRENWGLTPDECIEAVQWGLRTLSAQLAADDKSKKRK